MEDTREIIQEYLNFLTLETGRRFRTELKGLLVTIWDGDQIIYTSAGGSVDNRYQSIKGFLGGIVYGLKMSK